MLNKYKRPPHSHLAFSVPLVIGYRRFLKNPNEKFTLCQSPIKDGNIDTMGNFSLLKVPVFHWHFRTENQSPNVAPVALLSCTAFLSFGASCRSNKHVCARTQFERNNPQPWFSCTSPQGGLCSSLKREGYMENMHPRLSMGVAFLSHIRW